MLQSLQIGVTEPTHVGMVLEARRESPTNVPGISPLAKLKH